MGSRGDGVISPHRCLNGAGLFLSHLASSTSPYPAHSPRTEPWHLCHVLPVDRFCVTCILIKMVYHQLPTLINQEMGVLAVSTYS